VSIYEKRHLRKHRRLLHLQAGEFRAAEQNGWLSQSLFQGRMMTMMMLLFSQKYITTPTIN